MRDNLIIFVLISVFIMLFIFYIKYINTVKRRTILDLFILSIMIIISIFRNAKIYIWLVILFYIIIIVVFDGGGILVGNLWTPCYVYKVVY